MIGFLFARQRSGTGALGSVLDRHPELKYVGEVLHPDDQGNEVNFYRFLGQDANRSPAYINPKSKAHVITEYFGWLTDRFAPRIPIIDVKYRSIHNWNGPWQGLVERPWLVGYIKGNNLPLLHLKRNNFLESYVSGRLAEENSIWHAKTLDDVRVKSTTIDIRQMSRYLTDSGEEVRLIDTWLGAYKNMVVVDYATAFDAQGSLDGAVASRLKNLFQLKNGLTDLKPSFVKQSPKLMKESIANFPLVKKALSGTEFEWMVGT